MIIFNVRVWVKIKVNHYSKCSQYWSGDHFTVEVSCPGGHKRVYCTSGPSFNIKDIVPHD